MAPFVLSRKVELLRTRHNLVGVKKVYIEKYSLEMWGCLKQVSLFSEEARLHGYFTKLVGKMKDLKNQLRKKEDDVYQSELEVGISYIVVQGTAEELVE